MLDTQAAHGTLAALHEDGLRNDEGWSVQVLEPLGSDGENVPIFWRGGAKSIPVRPRVADRDKNDSTPLNRQTIHGLVRATGEAPCRAVQRKYALPHKTVTMVAEGGSDRIGLDIAPDHDAPSGMPAARHGFGGQRARAQGPFSCRVQAGSTRGWSESRYPASC
ncbi:hypothetical protein [Azohydromonas australica]|uniref:hypothetical protein n=1 Tax=Azohydromonas australica TaxID=364039 RepID=UPI00048D4045|nr:hypothetical protein [Azohydromonas australica]